MINIALVTLILGTCHAAYYPTEDFPIDVTFGSDPNYASQNMPDIVRSGHALRYQFEPMVHAFLSSMVSMDWAELIKFWSADTVCSCDLFLFTGEGSKVGFEGFSQGMAQFQMMVSDPSIRAELLSVSPDSGVAIVKVDESFKWNRNGQSCTLMDTKLILRFDLATKTLKRLDWYVDDPTALLSTYWTTAEKLFYKMWEMSTPEITADMPALDRISDEFTVSISNGFGLMEGLAITGKAQLLRLISFMTTGQLDLEEEQHLFATISRLHKLSFASFDDFDAKDFGWAILFSDESHVCAEMSMFGTPILIAHYTFRDELLHKEVITLKDPTLFYKALALSHHTQSQHDHHMRETCCHHDHTPATTPTSPSPPTTTFIATTTTTTPTIDTTTTTNIITESDVSQSLPITPPHPTTAISTQASSPLSPHIHSKLKPLD